MKSLFILLLLVAFISCGKEKLIDQASSLVGTWTHYSASDAWETLFIEASGDGTIKWYTNGKLFKDAKTKTWYVKDNTLYFGKVTFGLQPFEIEDYPAYGSTETIIGFDTLKPSLRFMKIDGLNYVERI